MKYAITLLLSFSLFIGRAQMPDTAYSEVPYDIWNYDYKGENESKWRFYIGSFEGYVFTEIMNIWHEYLGMRKEKRDYERLQEQSAAKLEILKRTWSEAKTYPAKIEDGWHNAVATDNINYHRVAQVLVKNNRVVKFVIDNYLPIRFLAANEIKNAKVTITLDHHNNESLEIVELYFLYDLDAPTIVPEPQHPGYVCFWTDVTDYQDVILRVDGRLYKNHLELDLLEIIHALPKEWFAYH